MSTLVDWFNWPDELLPAAAPDELEPLGGALRSRLEPEELLCPICPELLPEIVPPAG